MTAIFGERQVMCEDDSLLESAKGIPVTLMASTPEQAELLRMLGTARIGGEDE